MKSLLVIPLAVAAVFGVAIVVLSLMGMAIKPADPIVAGAIATVAGMTGLLPILKGRGRDVVLVVQLALAGTVIHLVIQVGLAVAIIAGHINHDPALPYWLLGGYWISLVALIWQLRRMILLFTNATKIPE